VPNEHRAARRRTCVTTDGAAIHLCWSPDALRARQHLPRRSALPSTGVVDTIHAFNICRCRGADHRAQGVVNIHAPYLPQSPRPRLSTFGGNFAKLASAQGDAGRSALRVTILTHHLLSPRIYNCPLVTLFARHLGRHVHALCPAHPNQAAMGRPRIAYGERTTLPAHRAADAVLCVSSMR
jgi:hypothetical protein